MPHIDEFREFATARTPALYHAARLMCGDPFVAEDLVQETLAKVYLAWGKRQIDNPAAYAHVTLMRTFISSKRRRSSTERPVEAVRETAFQDPDIAVRIDLMNALASLPATDRAVLVARYLDDQSIESIADAINKSTGATRRQASRALEKLRAALGPEFTLEGARA